MRDYIALKVNRWLVVVDDHGEIHQPGAGAAQRWLQPDGTELTLICRGDAIDIYMGKKSIYNLTITPRVAVALAWWVLRWHVFTMWCGVKSWLWAWSLRRVLDAETARRVHARS